MVEAELSLWTKNPMEECSFKNYRRKPAFFDKNGLLATDVDFDSCGNGTQVHVAYTAVHFSNGKMELCELTVPLYLFKGVHPRFAQGNIQLSYEMVHEIREGFPDFVPEQEYLPGFEP